MWMHFAFFLTCRFQSLFFKEIIFTSFNSQNASVKKRNVANC